MEKENGLSFRDGLELGWSIANYLLEKKYSDDVPGGIVDEFNEIYTKLNDDYNSERVQMMKDRFNLQL